MTFQTPLLRFALLPLLALSLLCSPGCDRQTDVEARNDTPRANASPATPDSSPDSTTPSSPVPRPSAQASARSTATTPSTPQLLLTGRITLADGSPASSATVSLRRANEDGRFDARPDALAQTSTSAHGHYRLQVRDNPLFYLFASAPECAAASVALRDEKALLSSSTTTGTYRVRFGEQSGQRRVSHDFVLHPGGTLAGKVVDDQGQGLAGIIVLACEGERSNQPGTRWFGATTSTLEGAFSMEGVPHGEVVLSTKPDERYVPCEIRVQAPAKDVVLQLSTQGAEVHGHVFLKSSGEGVSSATVVLRASREADRTWGALPERKTQTDALGAFSFDKLPACTFSLSASCGNLHLFPSPFPAGQDAFASPQAGAFSLRERETTSGLRLFLYPGHTLSGVVRDNASGQPIQGATVECQPLTNGKNPLPLSCQTKADGGYRLSGVWSERPYVAFTVSKPGYKLCAKQANKSIRSNTITLDPEQPEQRVDFDMFTKLTVSGTVRTHEGAPVAGAKVSVRSVGGVSPMSHDKAATDAAGAFCVEVLPNSRVRIQSEVPGYPMGFSDALRVTDSSLTGVQVRMEKGASLSGVVVGPDDEPLAGARITVQRCDLTNEGGVIRAEAHAESDRRGRFVLSALPATEVTVFAYREGFASAPSQRLKLQTGDNPPVRLKLLKEHFLAGRITARNGQPVSKARISFASAQMSNAAESDDRGNYRISRISGEAGRVVINANGYEELQQDNVRSDRDDANFVLTPLEDSPMVVATVVDWKSRQPLAQFSVTCSRGGEVQKDPNSAGMFIVKKMHRESHCHLTIEAPGCAALKTSIYLSRADEIPLQHTYSMGPGGSIRGRVTDGATKLPASGISVRLLDKNVYDWQNSEPVAETKTDSEGRFSFTAVPIGDHAVQARPQPPLPPVVKDAPRAKHEESLEMEDIMLGSGGRIFGRVIRQPGEMGVAGMRVVLRDSDQMEKSLQSDEQGRFEFSGLAAGQHTVELPDVPQDQSVTLAQVSDAKEVNFTVGACVLKGRVLRAGKPLTQAGVSLLLDGVRLRTVQLDAEGRFEMKNLFPSTLMLIVYLYSGSGDLHREEIAISGDGQVMEKTIVLRAYGRIEGQVVNAQDQPVKMARVRAIASSASGQASQEAEKWTDEWGRFVLEPVDLGSHRLTAYSELVGSAMIEDVQLTEEAATRQVLLKLGSGEGGSLISVARDASNGQPLPNATCTLWTPTGAGICHKSAHSDIGVLTIPNLPPGHYRMRVHAEGYASSERHIEIVKGQSTSIESALRPAHEIR